MTDFIDWTSMYGEEKKEAQVSIGVAAFIAPEKDSLTKDHKRLIWKIRLLAQQVGKHAIVILFRGGKSSAEQSFYCGADRVSILEDLNRINHVMSVEDLGVLVSAADRNSTLASMSVAMRNKIWIEDYAEDINFDSGRGRFVARVPTYSGRLVKSITLPSPAFVIAVAGLFGDPIEDRTRSGSILFP